MINEKGKTAGRKCLNKKINLFHGGSGRGDEGSLGYSLQEFMTTWGAQAGRGQA